MKKIIKMLIATIYDERLKHNYTDWLLLVAEMLETYDKKEYLDKEAIRQKVDKILEKIGP